jgi:hypothetical protein
MYNLSSNPPQKDQPSLDYIFHPEHQTSQVGLEMIETKLDLVTSTENMHCSLFVKKISTNKVFSRRSPYDQKRLAFPSGHLGLNPIDTLETVCGQLGTLLFFPSVF